VFFLCVFCVGPLCGPPLRWWVLCRALPSVWVPCVGPLRGSPVWVPCVGPLCVGPLCGSPVWVPCVSPSSRCVHVASTRVMSPARSHAPAHVCLRLGVALLHAQGGVNPRTQCWPQPLLASHCFYVSLKFELVWRSCLLCLFSSRGRATASTGGRKHSWPQPLLPSHCFYVCLKCVCVWRSCLMCLFSSRGRATASMVGQTTWLPPTTPVIPQFVCFSEMCIGLTVLFIVFVFV